MNIDQILEMIQAQQQQLQRTQQESLPSTGMTDTRPALLRALGRNQGMQNGRSEQDSPFLNDPRLYQRKP